MRLRRAMWAVMLWIGLATQAAAMQVSDSGYVVDMAGVLDSDTMREIDGALTRYIASTGFIFSVVTLADMAGDPLDLENVARVSLRNMVDGMADPQARVALLIWASTGQIAIARNDVHGRELSATEVARVLRDELLPQLSAGDIGAGLLRGVYGLIVAVSEPSDESGDPQELVMMARWDGAGDPVSPAAEDEPPAIVPGGGIDAATLVQAFRADPAAALAASRDRVREQWAALRARLGDLAAELQAGSGGNTIAFAVAGLVLLAVLAGAWWMSGGPSAPAVLAGLAAAVLCWGLTAYVELTMLLALSGVVVAIGLRLLRVMAANSHEARLQPGPYSAASRMPPPRPAVSPLPRATQAVPATASRSVQRADSARHAGLDFRASLERAHRDGVRTPMLDHLIANKDRLRASATALKERRQYWMIAIIISFFVLFPLALVLMVAWAASELNHLKPPQASLPEFVRRLAAELRAVARHHKPQT